MNDAEQHLVLKRERRQKTFGVFALTWLVTDGLFALAVVIVRASVGGQVGLAGLKNLSAADVQNLHKIEFLVAPVIALIVAGTVSAKAGDDLEHGYVEWWWSVVLPVLIGLFVFATFYYWGYAGALAWSDD